MAIRFRCDRCDQLLSIGTRKRGTQVQCTRCQAPLTVPAASTESGADANEQLFDDQSPQVVMPVESISGQGRNLLATATVATFLLVLLGGVGLAIAVLKQRADVDEGDGPVRAALPFEQPGPVPSVPLPGGVPDSPSASQASVESEPGRLLARAKPAPAGAEVAGTTRAGNELEGLAVTKPFTTEETKTARARPWKMKRIAEATDEDLRQQLLKVPEVSLDAVPNSTQRLLQVARTNAAKGLDVAPLLIAQRPDLAGLPHRMGMDCRLGKESAENLQALSRKLRTHLEAATPGSPSSSPFRLLGRASSPADPRPDPDRLRERLLGEGRKEWLEPEAIPALQQLLMAENKNVRAILVELLQQIPGKQASVALAQRAVFDLHPDVREAAARALRDRPGPEFQDSLIDALNYPWAPAAEHAAEALVALERHDLVPKLLPLLDARGPGEPFVHQVTPKKSVKVVRELVRINHLANCLLCHAPSLAPTDLVRGLVPTPGRPLPAPASTPAYYEGTFGTFVRADVTYVKQDFSVPQPVLQAEPWPAHQRFDYLVRLRPTSLGRPAAEQRPSNPGEPTAHQKALLFALRELTGQDAGPRAGDWKQLLENTPAAPGTANAPPAFTFLGYTFTGNHPR